ncbi:hypothetical protein AMQ84_27240 [Paenibacillus riograndensis]|uniref:Uncharacterized protein n=1 Tax=Paenibacillus riograndensis TaxID=483937 RepID=A0A132TJV5_9BACL|nr:hypothetical protein [Paenibacillus riograndensis]KWX71619.1 hypothetical protein AMQ84_27240 [Paenibacillus riograndensis]
MPGVDFRGTAGNTGTGIVIADGFQTSSGVSTPKVVLSTTITFDPPSLTTGAFAVSTAVTVTGVALGDSIELYPPYDTDGVIYQATPSASNAIKISLFNANSGTKDLASGTWGVVVKRRV